MTTGRKGRQPTGGRRREGGGKVPAPVRLMITLILPEQEREFFLGDLEEDPSRSWPREILSVLALRFAPGPSRFATRKRPRKPKGDGMFPELLQDLRFGARSMIRSPGFTLVALITMALGIGANTAMFSIVNGVIFKPLPYPHPDRIVLIRETNLPAGWSSFSVSPLNYWDWQERNRSLDLTAAYQRTSVSYTGGDQPESVPVYLASENFLEILGGSPLRGRGISRDDLDPDAEPVVVLTYGFWQRTFGGDPDVLGRTMALDGRVHTVVGVLSEDWQPFSTSSTDLILPLRPEPFWYTARGSHFLHVLGRLGPDVTLNQAQADLSSIAAALEAAYPDSNTDWGVSVRPLEEVLLGSTGPQLLIFLAIVGLVLLIGCANLANMTLARAAIRTREFAIRTAVGAGKGRVVRQLLAESLLLATMGGILGVGLAYLALGAFVAGWPTMLPRMQEIEVNSTVLLFSLGISLASGILFGLFPALSLAGTSLQDTLRQGGRGLAGDRSRRWMRSGLVVAEVGLAVVLLVGTGLLVRSFSALQAQDPGFQTNGRLVLSTPLARAKYSAPELTVGYTDAVLAGMSALPGVESVALTSLIPLGGSDEIWGYWIESRALPGAKEDGSALFYRVSPGYFDAMGIPLLAGRDIAPGDRENEPQVMVVSASFAQQLFQGESPLGQRIKFGRDDDDLPAEIVGVVGDVQHYTLGEGSIPQVYLPFPQRPTGNVNFVLKTSLPPLSLVAGARKAVEAVDPDQPLVGVQTADAMISDSISMPRFRTLLMTGFGLTALLLAVVGLYGVLAYSVSQRSKEIGVRMALGASRGSVLSLVFREGMPLVVVGLGIGLVGSFSLSRILGSMLFGVGARDPGVFAAVPLGLGVVAAAAMFIPARRAAGVDPVKTLTEE